MNETHPLFTFNEVATHLRVTPDTLQRLQQRFGQVLGTDVDAALSRYSSTDVAALVTVQRLLEQGYTDSEIVEFLTPVHMDVDSSAALSPLPPTEALAPVEEPPAGSLPKTLADVLSAIANGQQAVLNSQSTVRELVGTLVQDNFNLKTENRKLRERMLELERALAEYQRREETRKERTEGRLRGLESTVSALQQQVSQLIQVERQRTKRRGWFG
jgi:DNA-binding transcriptional MerR regulator